MENFITITEDMLSRIRQREYKNIFPLVIGAGALTLKELIPDTAQEVFIYSYHKQCMDIWKSIGDPTDIRIIKLVNNDLYNAIGTKMQLIGEDELPRLYSHKIDDTIRKYIFQDELKWNSFVKTLLESATVSCIIICILAMHDVYGKRNIIVKKEYWEKIIKQIMNRMNLLIENDAESVREDYFKMVKSKVGLDLTI